MKTAEHGKLLGNNKTGFGFNQVQDFLALFVSICEVFKFSLIPGPVSGTPRSVFNQRPECPESAVGQMLISLVFYASQKKCRASPWPQRPNDPSVSPANPVPLRTRDYWLRSGNS